MTVSTIRQLNAINQQFYQTIAADFSASREKPWEGWQQLLPYLPSDSEQKMCTVDIGCGNGRWGEFLINEAHLKNLEYIGIDANEHLLSIANKKLVKKVSALYLKKVDIIEGLIAGNFSRHITSQKPHLITLFGVLHHIPSFHLREKIISELSALLAPKGILIFTVWNFDKSLALMQRKKDPEALSVSPKDLEPNDYFLTWERGERAVRYCHLIDQQEIEQLLRSSELQLLSTFLADKNLNTYIVLQKK